MRGASQAKGPPVSVFEVFQGDNGAIIANSSTVELGPIAQQVMGRMSGLNDPADGPLGKVAAAIASWAESTQGPADRRLKGIFDRDRYVNPESAIDKMRVARDALEDDVIGGAADVTERLAVKGCKVKCLGGTDVTAREVLDQEDIWNQLAGRWDLDARLKEWWRNRFVDSQVVVATWWEQQEFESREPTPAGQRGRKTWTINAPSHIDFIDATRVAPVGVMMFRQERLAYIASANEAWVIEDILKQANGYVPEVGPGANTPAIVNRSPAYPRSGGDRYAGSDSLDGGIDLNPTIINRLILGRYRPGWDERIKLERAGVNTTNLFLFDNRFVFRSTATRSGFERFARVRLSSTFELLDLKHQLRQLERALLIGGAQYIVLITLGETGKPTQQVELNHLRASVNTLGSVPVVVGDHRLNIEIVTPKVDLTLDGDRHSTLDVRLTARAYGTFAATGSDTDDPVKLARVIGAGLENARGEMVRAIQDNIFQAIRDNNPGIMTARAELKVLPRTVALAFDSAWASFMIDLRAANEISRETILDVVDLNQGDEASERIREAGLGFDDVFRTMNPFGPQPDQGGGDQPAGGPLRTQTTTKPEQRQAGRQRGGRRNGGGRAPGTRQGQESARPRRSDTRPGRAALDVLADYVDDHIEPENVEAVLAGLTRTELIEVAGQLPEPIKNRHQARAGALADDIAAAIKETDHG